MSWTCRCSARIARPRGLTKTDKDGINVGMNPYDIDGVQPGEFITIKQDKPITSFVAVSSQVAEQWLAHNTHNRPLSEKAVLEYQSDMEAGRFGLEMGGWSSD